ncbi:MAG: PRC-barrel domain-containing protein [Desulfobacterales bacterium]
MKKYLLVTLLTIVMFLPSGGAFAHEKNASVTNSIVPGMPASKNINAFRIDKIIGSGVINLEGKRIGTISDLVINIDTGKIEYAALEFGGFMGFDDKLFAVPWQSLTAVPADGIFIIDQSEKRLKKAPGFDKNSWPDVNDKSWGAGIYEFYRHHLPYPQASATPLTPVQQQVQDNHRAYPGYAAEPSLSNVWANVYEKMFNPEKIESVSGRILRVEFSEGLQLVIYSDAKKPVLVALGPNEYFGGEEKYLRPGDKVTVTGSMVIVDDTPLLIATKVREGNEQLKISNNEGHPLWMGWQKIE